jgi:hypothetical protein
MKKISFIVYYPYQWFIYKNIYNSILDIPKEVIIDLSVHPHLQNEKLEIEIKLLLQNHNIPFRVLRGFNFLDKEYIRDFFSSVEVIVSCWETGCVSLEEVNYIKKVNTTYGLAKELTMVRPSRSIYDIILAYGKRDQKHFSMMTKSIAIGNPRMDDYYSGVKNCSKEKITKYFANNKKNLVYVPTHGDLSSYKEMFEEIKTLSKTWNIIFKPHYYTLREDKEYVEKYKDLGNIFFVNDSWDTIDVLASGDVILSDNSSVIFDAIQVDRPIIVCDFLSNEFIDIMHKEVRFLKRGAIGASTYSKSFEQEIKENGKVITIKHPNELRELLENINIIDKPYKVFRQEIQKEYFEYTDGKSADRASSIIKNIYEKPRKYNPGVMYHAYLTYSNRMYQGLLRQQIYNPHVSIFNRQVIVWVCCDIYSKKDDVMATVCSALNEKNVSKVCISGFSAKDLMFFPDLYKERIVFFYEIDDIRKFFSTQEKSGNVLLVVKPNTIVKDLPSVISLKEVAKRNILFFLENPILQEESSSYKVFYTLRSEIINCFSYLKELMVSVMYEQIHSLEKNAILCDLDFFHGSILEGLSSVDREDIFTLLVEAENVAYYDFVVLPNFFFNKMPSDDDLIYHQLIKRGERMVNLGILPNRWPDKKILFYFYKTISGNVRYYRLLVLLFSKYITTLFVLLEKKIRYIKNATKD